MATIEAEILVSCESHRIGKRSVIRTRQASAKPMGMSQAYPRPIVDGKWIFQKSVAA